ncbi:MAG TPA: c-type cytochrome biogenesis protein CcmI, partial [Ramlibacter sp.]|nr:c-type cytochrome biogenesis protein CcmI [Ramlibacter sp.]
VALVLVLLLRPFLGKNIAVHASQRQLNAAIFREELAKLDQDLAEGTLAREDHAQARAELQRRALDDTREADAATTLRAPRRTMVTVALVVPLLAGGLYLMLGNPASMSGQVDPHVQQQDLERLVASLAKKLEQEPDNLQGWAMLARSYKVLGKMQEAELAFERAGSFIDNDAQMLANYADVAATNAGGSLKGKPAQLIAKALKADPQNPMALWLSGTEALERQDYDRALATWDRLMALLPPGSEDANMLQGAIAEVRSRAGKPVQAAAAPAAEPKAAAPGGPSITGTVEVAAALKDKAAPDDTVMVIARLPGSRMPVAVVRARASELPVKFTLDD